ncbi:MAG: SIR2 family protein, partial [Acidobacteriota bacterium]
LTTNFDCLLSRAYSEYFDEDLIPAMPGQTPDIPKIWRGIWHLHGSILDPGSIQVVESSIEREFLGGNAGRTLTDFFREFDVLFLGYALADEFVRRALGVVGPGMDRTYWVAHPLDEAPEPLDGPGRLKFIEYDKRDGHRGLFSFVEELASSTSHDVVEELDSDLLDQD